MKKILSVILTLVLVTALMVSFAACNKDTFESVDVDKAEAIEIIAEFTEKTANATGFSIAITDADSSAEYIIMAQENRSALMGTNPDGEKIFIGKMWNELLDDYDTAGYFVYEDGEWMASAEPFESESKSIDELGCNAAVTALERILKNDEDELTISLKKNLKNGNLVNYEGTITYEELTLSFKTVDNGGVQLIAELTDTENDESVSYKYEYGKSFEVPVA